MRSGVIAKKLGMTRLFMEDGHRNLLAVFHEKAGHPHLLCDDTGTEHLDPSLTP